jgi:hypothetical protein
MIVELDMDSKRGKNVTSVIRHILCCCPFSREVWLHICQALRRPLPPMEQTVIAWWRRLRSSWPNHQRKGIDSLFALVSWQIWKE